MPFQCPSSPDLVENAERWAEPGSLEDSCPSNARARLIKDGGAIMLRWPFDKGSVSLMKSE
jgi:hypothetical protein